MNEPILNKKASFDFQLLEKFEAGIILTGSEVKSIRAGSASLAEAYVKIDNNTLPKLINAYIAPYKMAIDPSYDPRRERELLLNRNEIEKLGSKVGASRLTIVPVKVYIKANLVKLEIALASPKKKADKREALKKKALSRETESYLRTDKKEHQKTEGR